jgi:hypothetical protein
MALSTVITGGQINAGDVNQLVNVLQQPGGGQEKGKYFLAGAIYGNGALVTLYMPSLSRNSAPVSVTIDEADQLHTAGINAAPITGQLTAGGFQIYTLSTTGPTQNARAGGNYTIQY